LPGKRPWKNMRTSLRQYFTWEEALDKYENFLKTIFCLGRGPGKILKLA